MTRRAWESGDPLPSHADENPGYVPGDHSSHVDDVILDPAMVKAERRRTVKRSKRRRFGFGLVAR